jgi:hypothetical protein
MQAREFGGFLHDFSGLPGAMRHPGESGSILTPHLLRRICAEGVLEPWGIHGLGHWARVRETGLRLAASCKRGAV